jgi:deoxyribodipyrimidine photo-lyase
MGRRDAVTAVVWFTRDLRVHDHPALHAAATENEHVVPVFVLDETILRSPYSRPNRARFLLDCLRDLDESLRALGAGLVVRRGDPADEVARLAREVDAAAVHASADVSGYAQRRAERTAAALGVDRRPLRLHRGVTVLPPGQGRPPGTDHAAIFSPYFRRWIDAPRRTPLAPPSRLRLPAGIDRGRLPEAAELGAVGATAELPPGGERAGRDRLDRWLRDQVSGYADGHDDLAGDRTSRLSPYLHFGCLSPGEILARADRRRAGVDAFVRQLAWRDFHAQMLAARPLLSAADYRPRGDRWVRDPDALQAWQEGRTGVPLVDAGMRQLRREGWMHNRARLVTASYLTKHLYLDWRVGARHFLDHLVDGDIANNQLNWQWVAGTGADTRPNRMFNPQLQGERYDPDGDYVRRYVPELAGVPGRAVHAPWRLADDARRRLDYPPPLVDHAEAVRRFRAARGGE